MGDTLERPRDDAGAQAARYRGATAYHTVKGMEREHGQGQSNRAKQRRKKRQREAARLAAEVQR